MFAATCFDGWFSQKWQEMLHAFTELSYNKYRTHEFVSYAKVQKTPNTLDKFIIAMHHCMINNLTRYFYLNINFISFCIQDVFPNHTQIAVLCNWYEQIKSLVVEKNIIISDSAITEQDIYNTTPWEVTRLITSSAAI